MVTRHLLAHGDMAGVAQIMTDGGPVDAQSVGDDRVEVQMGRATFPGMGEDREELPATGTRSISRLCQPATHTP